VNPTIAAISTPPGEGGVAVIRISGERAVAIAGTVFSSPLAGRPREMVYGRILHGGEIVDRGLAVIFPAPRSYTGEDMAEIHCHGGIVVSARVLEAVLEAGATAAAPGEFTQRAFLNGKMDLTQAEAVMDVIRARTPLALAAASEQLSGRLGDEFRALRERLIGLVAHVEAWIDFPEEDIDPATGAALIGAIHDARAAAESLLGTAATGRILREGVRLVICGAPNAGKSSLLNRLLGWDRAIVTPTPGTTRDTIEELANLGGLPFRITDTAGLRATDDPVESLGVNRARDAIAAADILLHVIDASDPAADPPGAEFGAATQLLVANKCDLVGTLPPGLAGCAHPVSCATGAGLAELVDGIVRTVAGAVPRPSAAAINARHQACLARARDGLNEAAAELAAGNPPELAAIGLRSALDAVGEILGRADSEEILGEIFARFCIGK